MKKIILESFDFKDNGQIHLEKCQDKIYLSMTVFTGSQEEAKISLPIRWDDLKIMKDTLEYWINKRRCCD